MAARTIILATNHHQSPLQLLTGEGARGMAFGPYGYNALGVAAGTPRFNGERLDPVTGHYLLGNGYRGYNPALRRFNSPDRLSPFGEGGLNAYVYCAGDPVNRTDPSGRFSLRKWMARLIRPTRRSPTTAANVPDIAGAKPQNVLTNFQKIGGGAMMFTDNYKGRPRLNVSAHGEYDHQRGIGTVIVDGQGRDPMWLSDELQDRGVNFKEFANARILACYSADEGAVSFASYFSRYSGLPTKGYQGRLFRPSVWAEIRDGLRVGEESGIRIVADRPFMDKTNPFKESDEFFHNFSYKPVKFYPG